MGLLKRFALVAVAALALSGCTPGAGVPEDPVSPEPGTSAAPSPEGSGEPEEPDGLSLPEDCAGLVPVEWFRADIDASFQEIPYEDSGVDPVADDFTARGGLACLWGIPQTDAGVRLFVAERAAASDEEQVAEWRSAGFQECPAFLDACWFDRLDSMLGEYVTVYALVEGYELRSEGFGHEIDPYLSLIRQATDSMGYL